MSTDFPSSAGQPIEQRYLQLLATYDALALKFKRQRLTVWCLGLLFTWLPLSLALLGVTHFIANECGESADRFVLKYAIPTLQGVGSVVVLIQIFYTHRGRWLKYRAATERLRNHGMRFRACAGPYAGDIAQAEAEFNDFLNRLESEMVRERAWPLRGILTKRIWAAVSMYGTPGSPYPNPPDEGLYPRVGDPAHGRDADTALVLDRLRNQRQWHLTKAGYYYRCYVAWQSALLVTYLASMFYIWTVGRDYRVVILVSSLGFVCSSVRDFLEYGPLSLRYTQLADTLDRIEQDYTGLIAKADDKGYAQLLAELANAVEDRLASEFRAWYLVQEVVTEG